MNSRPLPSLEEFETPNPTHPLAIALLKLYSHAFSEELPLGLPP